MSSEQPQIAADGLPFATAPLRWLVREKLHAGTTLAQRVVVLRWRRKRPAKADASAAPDAEAQP